MTIMTKRKHQSRQRNVDLRQDEEDQFYRTLDRLGLTEADYDEIKSDIEGQIQQLADLSAAQSHSALDDQTMIDLEDKGFDDEGAVKVASFGWEAAANGDVLVPPGWYEILQLEPSPHPQTWIEAGTAGPHPRNAMYELEAWLVNHGYEKVYDLSGDWPGGSEAEIAGDTIIDALSREGNWTLEQVNFVYDREYGEELVYWSSHDGEITTYARPVTALQENPWKDWAKDEPVLATAAGAGLGSLAGVIAGSVVGAPGLGSIVGGAIGGHAGAPADRKSRGAWGGGIGGLFTPIGAAAGGAIGGRKASSKHRAKNASQLKKKLLR